MKYDTAVFIGRLQPMHLGHEYVINETLKKANEVIVVLGSAYSPRDLRNPFTAEERKQIIKSVFKTDRVKVAFVSDYPYDDNKWVAEVQKVVLQTMSKNSKTISLAGHKKDESSYYLNLFKGWGEIAVNNFENINATEIREDLFLDNFNGSALNKMSYNAYEKMSELMNADDCWAENLLYESREIEAYKEQFEDSPYPPFFVTTDAVLTQSGHILMIKRKKFPYADKWALPGGYLEQNLNIETNMIKELHEETKVKVPEKVLKGSIVSTKVFDAPKRDPRGRTITHAYYINLGFPPEDLPKVKGESDAKEAKWFRFSELKQEDIAFDHWHIINHFLKLS